MIYEYYIYCYERNLVLEIDPADKQRVSEICEAAYDFWVNNADEVGDICCEEYIVEQIEAAGIKYRWFCEEE